MKIIYLYEEYDDKNCFIYPSKKVIDFIKHIQVKLFSFFAQHAPELNLEFQFKTLFSRFEVSKFYEDHDIQNEIFEKCVRLVIYKYL